MLLCNEHLEQHSYWWSSFTGNKQWIHERSNPHTNSFSIHGPIGNKFLSVEHFFSLFYQWIEYLRFARICELRTSEFTFTHAFELAHELNEPARAGKQAEPRHTFSSLIRITSRAERKRAKLARYPPLVIEDLNLLKGLTFRAPLMKLVREEWCATHACTCSVPEPKPNLHAGRGNRLRIMSIHADWLRFSDSHPSRLILPSLCQLGAQSRIPHPYKISTEYLFLISNFITL